MTGNIVDNLSVAAEEVEVRFEKREKTLACARKVIKAASRAVSTMHSLSDGKTDIGHVDRAFEDMQQAWRELSGTGYTDRNSRDAAVEYAEAHIFRAFLLDTEYPSHRDLGVGADEYILGSLDGAGEARRYALRKIMAGDTAEAERALEFMNGIYDTCSSMHYPAGYLPVRQKLDTLRALLDRTAEDLLYSSRKSR